MGKKEYHVIGVMSGTSLDGIDLVEAKFYFNKTWCFEIINAETIAYDNYWRNVLKDLVKCTINALKSIDEEYTIYLAKVLKSFIKRHEITGIDAVCSHGHTALHQPEKGLTYQIGNRSELAHLLGERLVCDFRKQDVELGGQGAPLVPIGDKLLFSEFDFCLNLGGFANISLEVNNERVAYDICPVNIVLNQYANIQGLPFDAGGHIASTGKIKPELLEALNALEFYSDSYPKSLGLEWVALNVIPLIDSFNLDVKDVLRTFVEHAAFQIADKIHLHAIPNARVLVTGGGVYNDFLMERIKQLTKQTILIPSAHIVEFKEALIFAFLGVLKLSEQNNCLKSVTGASKDHCSGKVFLP